MNTSKAEAAAGVSPGSPVVRTVLGDVGWDFIDRVMPHEHLLCDFSTVTQDRNHIFNNPHFAVEEVKLLNAEIPARGGAQHLIAEMTLPDLGRDPTGLVRISRESGTHVVMGTGWYLEPYYPEHVYRTPSHLLAEEMVNEIRDGVQTPTRRVKAGIIGEIGTHGGNVSPAEERVLRAAAQASIETGVSVSTHAFLYPTGTQQADILLDQGMDPSRIAIGHADTFLDPVYHRELLQRGVYLQFDTCGREHIMPDSLRVEFLRRYLDEGWENQLLISSDRCHKSDLRMFGGLGYSWTFGGFCELLRNAGISEEAIDRITRANPLELLSTRL